MSAQGRRLIKNQSIFCEGVVKRFPHSGALQTQGPDSQRACGWFVKTTAIYPPHILQQASNRNFEKVKKNVTCVVWNRNFKWLREDTSYKCLLRKGSKLRHGLKSDRDNNTNYNTKCENKQTKCAPTKPNMDPVSQQPKEDSGTGSKEQLKTAGTPCWDVRLCGVLSSNKTYMFVTVQTGRPVVQLRQGISEGRNVDFPCLLFTFTSFLLRINKRKTLFISSRTSARLHNTLNTS